MRLIESSYKILPQESGIEGIYKMCEIAGRTAYKSEDKITEGSAKKFVDAMMKSNHGAVLEHGTVYLFADFYEDKGGSPLSKYKNNKYSKYTWNDNGTYVTTNLRVLFENGWMDDLQYWCEPTEYHEKRVTVKFTCSRSIAQEITRHRVFSFLMESQRYVAYNREKFGGEITYIIPDWVKLRMNDLSKTDFEKCTDISVIRWLKTLQNLETNYMNLISDGLKAEEARSVLPNDCKTELIMTGFISDWKHFFDLRADGITGAPHPDIKKLAEPLKQKFIELGLYES